jgi:hypothetical protein
MVPMLAEQSDESISAFAVLTYSRPLEAIKLNVKGGEIENESTVGSVQVIKINCENMLSYQNDDSPEKQDNASSSSSDDDIKKKKKEEKRVLVRFSA